MDYIDKIMSEEHQGEFAEGLREAMAVIVEYLPPSAYEEIPVRLDRVRGVHHVERPTTGLAIGMVTYWLEEVIYDITHRPPQPD
jgi:hypothetical protein